MTIERIRAASNEAVNQQLQKKMPNANRSSFGFPFARDIKAFVNKCINLVASPKDTTQKKIYYSNLSEGRKEALNYFDANQLPKLSQLNKAADYYLKNSSNLKSDDGMTFVKGSNAFVLKSEQQPYVILNALVGQGGVKTVYLGINLNTGALVAVSRLELNKDPEGYDTSIPKDVFVKLQKLGSESSSGVQKLHDRIQTAQHQYVVQEYCEEGTLIELLESNDCPAQKKLALASQVANGLAQLHSEDLLHKDFKAENVFLKNGQALLSDFDYTELASKVSEAAGCVQYLSPEALQEAQYTKKTESWAMGIVLYRMFKGELPQFVMDLEGFDPSVNELADNFFEDRMPQMVDSPLAQLIRNCFKIKADERPSVEEIATTLASMKIEDLKL